METMKKENEKKKKKPVPNQCRTSFTALFNTLSFRWLLLFLSSNGYLIIIVSWHRIESEHNSDDRKQNTISFVSFQCAGFVTISISHFPFHLVVFGDRSWQRLRRKIHLHLFIDIFCCLHTVRCGACIESQHHSFLPKTNLHFHWHISAFYDFIFIVCSKQNLFAITFVAIR